MLLIELKQDKTSWDEIHDILFSAHAQNRERGIHMRYSTLPGEEIEAKIAQNNGQTFVAYADDKPIGTASYIIKKGKSWYNKGKFAYFCLQGYYLKKKEEGFISHSVTFEKKRFC